MTAQAVEPVGALKLVVAQLSHAGLNLSLAPCGGLAVAPASRLTSHLRGIIRSSKTVLVDWLTAANDALHDVPVQPIEPLGWKVLAAAYYAHHFSCPTCIAAGRGAQYGQRCSAGMASWTSYCECIPKPCSITESS